jgi:8-oxo-dGTP pyrophosphatase MutT (NUDIX family)
MSALEFEINNLINSSSITPEVRNIFLTRIREGSLTRDENTLSHLCVYFLPYNPSSKKVFLVHHKKAKLWLSPGGHIDKGESPLETLQREVKEELGFDYQASTQTQPFLFTTVSINNPVVPCKTHFDIWYGIRTDGSNFEIDPREFNETRWLTIVEARELVIDSSNLQALDIVENNLFSETIK